MSREGGVFGVPRGAIRHKAIKKKNGQELSGNNKTMVTMGDDHSRYLPKDDTTKHISDYWTLRNTSNKIFFNYHLQLHSPPGIITSGAPRLLVMRTTDCP